MLDTLAKLERDFDVFDQWGFRDSVNVDSGRVSDFYLSLDQGMIMAALGNALAGDVLRRDFVDDDMARSLRPVMGVEEFNSDPRGCTVTGTRGDDVLRGGSGDDVICALRGDDTILASGGDDAIFGDDGDDVAEGAGGDDTLYGGPGDDDIAGGEDWDVLSGGPGDDLLRGGAGADHHEGGAGTNRCPDLAGGDTANACG